MDRSPPRKSRHPSPANKRLRLPGGLKKRRAAPANRRNGGQSDRCIISVWPPIIAVRSEVAQPEAVKSKTVVLMARRSSRQTAPASRQTAPVDPFSEAHYPVGLDVGETRDEIASEAAVSPADLELKRRLVQFLVGRGVPVSGRIWVEVERGHVTFRGVVSCFYHRQICIACQRHDGVAGIVDDLQVCD